MKSLWMAAVLMLSATAAAADTQLDEMRALIEAQQRQIELLRQQLDRTSASLETLQQMVADNVEATEQANEKAEILAANLETLPAGSESANSLGGYGELHLNMLENQATGENTQTLDFHRFVLFYGHRFNDRLRFSSELEIEHAVAGGDEPGEVELEQAYVEYDWAAGHSLRAGLFLVPVGILNETHEPPTFYGVERNPVERHIIPSTWWEGGLAFNGLLADAWRYDVAMHSGLNTSAAGGYAVRDGRQSGAEAKFDAPAWTGRLRWLGVPGLELSASVQYQQDVTQESDPMAGSAWLFSGHAAWQVGGFGLRALYARWSLDGVGPKAVGADRQEGWYVEPSWRFNEQWGLFARYSRWDNLAGNAADTEYAQTDFGVNFWLHPNVVFKFDYQNQDAARGRKEMDGWNLGVGYQF
jgi:HAMP domain-containing protein